MDVMTNVRDTEPFLPFSRIIFILLGKVFKYALISICALPRSCAVCGISSQKQLHLGDGGDLGHCQIAYSPPPLLKE